MLFGPDIANYQKGINLQRIRDEGCEFICLKATQGTGYKSPDYPRQRDHAIRAGLLTYAYHYIDKSDPAAQARNCLSYLGDRNLAVMLDWEEGSGDGAWLRTVHAAFVRAGIRVPLIYGPKWYWEKVGRPSLAGLPPLVASSYPSTKSADERVLYRNVTEKRWAGYGGNNVALLQFTDRAAIAGMQIDCNAYPGTREQLTALLYGNAPIIGPSPSALRTAPVEDDVSQTFMQGSGNIQVEAECGQNSALYQNAWVIVLIPHGTAHVTVFPANDHGGGKSTMPPKMTATLNKEAGFRRVSFKMPEDNTDACVQWFGATSPVTVKVLHKAKGA